RRHTRSDRDWSSDVCSSDLEELKTIELIDFTLGGVFALAFVLVFTPAQWKAHSAWLVAVIGAAVVWLCVSGSLIWTHREQVRIRSEERRVGKECRAWVVSWR